MSLLETIQAEFGTSVEARPAASEILDGVFPQAVAAPFDEAAAGALVAWCGKQNLAFIARGGGSQWHVGALPRRFDILISTEKLNSIIEHDEGNATVEAQAGVALQELDRQVRQSGQFVPFDWTGGAATLGGAVATNRSGGTRLKYGAPRDLVTGVRVALSDGREIIGGGKVVKNVSGYDLPKIFTGSRGSLGLLTRATIRLRPLSSTSRFWQSTFHEAQAAATGLRAIFEGPFEPTLLRAIFRDGIWRVEAQFEGGENAVQSQLNRLDGGEIVAHSSVFGGGAIELRAQLPIDKAFEWTHFAIESGAREAIWEAGGTVMVALEAAVGRETIEALRAAALKYGGWMIVERAPVEWKSAELVWGKPRSDWSLMQRLKKSYDAADVCAPGRFAGGL